METTSSFGYWIRRQRKALDLTQQTLADKVGCSLAAIKKIEGDERRPSRQIAERMADILGVPANQRETFLEVARGLRPVDQLLLAREPAVPTPTLPTGIVTFLFTDIEGSTLLSQKHPDAMKTALVRHHAILRMAIELHNGHVLQVVGDSFSAAFENVLDALNAALAVQRGLRDEPWGETGPIHVRMGLHTGMAEMSKETTGMPYAGYSTIAITHRIMSAAHGGQILLSQVTRELMGELLPSNVTLLDVGEHRLKDVLRPIHLYQVTATDLPSDFPPLKSLSALPTNLPMQLTSFIGRGHELSEIKQLLTTTHLLTLTGPGGTGKTRLALQLAAEVLETSPDGVWLVELAPLADLTLVAQTIAATLGVREQPGRTILDALIDYVRTKSILLILDNCEHLIEACAQLANTLLRAAPRLKILATSREPLGIAGETSYRVPSLPLPDPRQLHDLEAFAQNDCVHLFVDRAMAAYPSFRLKEKNSLAIANICRRLDGIPLALELAAARTKVFPPEEIASRLDDRFKLLTGGSRTALERHQTLFALIDWSHNLLSEAERVFLRRLSVFAGDWSFRAAEAVCSQGTDEETLDLLTHLVDKSLVIVEEQEGEVRYRFLETVRHYARDKLLESSESAQMRDRHLGFFLQFAEEAAPNLRGPEQIVWQKRLEAEHDNVRAALEWALKQNANSALRLAVAMQNFWSGGGYLTEGRQWLQEALAEVEESDTVQGEMGRARTTAEAKALTGLGLLAIGQGDNAAARLALEQSIALARAVGDKRQLAEALVLLAGTPVLRDLTAVRVATEEGLALAREIGDKFTMALAFPTLAWVSWVEGDLQSAQAHMEQNAQLARETGNPWLIAMSLLGRANGVTLLHQYAEARAQLRESNALFRELGSKNFANVTQSGLANIARLEGDYEQAVPLYRQTIAAWQELGHRSGIARCLECLALIAGTQGHPQRAARLFGAAESLRQAIGAPQTPEEQMEYERALPTIRAQLDPATFDAAWAEGQQLTMEQAIALAIENEGEDSQPPPANTGSA